MDYTNDYFYKTFTPCSEQRIEEIEQSLGLQLPEGYRELLRQTGGGILDEEKRFTLPFETYGEGFELDIEIILGNSPDIDSVENAKDFNDPEWWGVPEGLLTFGFASLGPGHSFAINYGREEFPIHSIIFIDIENDHDMFKLADSFEDFMGLLVKPDWID